MVLVTLGLYFLVTIALAAILLFPEVRQRVLAAASVVLARLSGKAASLGTRSAGTARASVDSALGSFSEFRKFIVQHQFALICALAILALPPLIALALQHRHVFQYDDVLREPDEKIAALLNGERLIPPPPLPPEVFTTREVELIRPAISEASRNWEQLDADFRQRLLLVYKIMREEHGYEMALLEGYRSPERQNKLAAMGSNVTQAAAFQSYHQFGLAADSAFYRNGKLVISEKDPWAMKGYELYGKVAESAGLTWGGRWKMMDLGHIELRRPNILRKP